MRSGSASAFGRGVLVFVGTAGFEDRMFFTPEDGHEGYARIVALVKER